MFGGYLPVERTTANFSFKTQRQLCAQRGENAHTNTNVLKGIDRYLGKKTEIRGQVCLQSFLAP